MTTNFKAMVKDVAQHREEIIERMVNFSLTDTLLFRSPDAVELIEEERKVWDPIVAWAREKMKIDFQTTQSLEAPIENNASLPRLQVFLESLSDKELVAFYEVSKITKSVLLAAAFVKGKVNADETFKAAFLEEIWQADKWGHDEQADKRRDEIKQELKDVEDFLKK